MPEATRRRMRGLVAAACAVLVAIVFAGCGNPIAFDRLIDEGRRNAEEAVRAAGYGDEMAVAFTCTGALPWQADHCFLTLDLETDDLDDVRRLSTTGLAPTKVIVRYRGLEHVHDFEDPRSERYRFDADEIAERIERVEAMRPAETDGEVQFSDDRLAVGLVAGTTAARACEVAEAFFAEFAVGMSTSVEGGAGRVPFTVQLLSNEPDVPSGIDGMCALVDAFQTTQSLDDVDGIHLTGWNPGPGLAAELLVSVGGVTGDPPPQQVVDRVEAWFSDQDVPDGLEVHVR